MSARRAVASALVVLLGLLGLTAPAHAAGELGLSSDGLTWSGSLDDPLFDPDFRWVPGDELTRSFYVRNQSADDGVLSVRMLDVAVDSLIATGDLEVAARVGSGPWTGVATPGPHDLVIGEAVPGGAVRKVDIRIGFDPTSGNESQETSLDLRFDVTLSQDTSVAPPTTGGPGDGDPGDPDVASPGTDLPDTGSTLSPALVVLAGLLCSVGFALAGFGRRSRDTEERQSRHA